MRPIHIIGALVLVAGTLLVLAAVRPNAGAPATTPTGQSQRAKKLIEYGWDVPSPAFLPAHIQEMEQRLFDGVVVRLTVGPYIFTHSAYEDAKFTQDRADLKSTAFSRFTDNFLIVWASSEDGWNFLSDSDWTAAEQNLRNFARTAAAGGFKGILFDTETYGPNTWAYNTNLYPNTTFEQLQAVVRKRGARFMNILQDELPAVRVIVTWFLGKVQYDHNASGGNLANSSAPLFSAFVEGMFSATNGDTRLIDGNEMSYNYTDAAAFDQSRSGLLAGIDRLPSEYQDSARAHIQTAQAIYADGLLNMLNSPRFPSFYIDSQ